MRRVGAKCQETGKNREATGESTGFLHVVRQLLAQLLRRALGDLHARLVLRALGGHGLEDLSAALLRVVLAARQARVLLLVLLHHQLHHVGVGVCDQKKYQD